MAETYAQAMMTAYIESFFTASALSGDIFEPWYHAHPNGVVPNQEL